MRWAQASLWEGRYEVSEDGQVRSLERYAPSRWNSVRRVPPCILTQRLSNSGYLYVNLSRSNKTTNVFVHTLVLEAFAGTRPPGMEACHNDGNRLNNSIHNLRWATHAENQADQKMHGTALMGARNPQARLNYEAVSDIRSRYAAGGVLQRELAAEFGVDQATIGRVVRGELWK